MEAAKPTRFLRLPEVSHRTGVSEPRIYSLMADGAFPRPVTLGANSRAWIELEVDAWIEERIKARDERTDAEWRLVHTGIGRGRPKKHRSAVQVAADGRTTAEAEHTFGGRSAA
jgi:prophage regulatory protein